MRSQDPHTDADAGPAREPVRTDTSVSVAAGVALVSVTLHNDTAAGIRVRVENDLDGPVLPPRREGVPAAGWDADGYTGTVAPDGRLGVGYACPVTGADAGGEIGDGGNGDGDAVSVDLLGPVGDARDDAPTSPGVDAVVRSLGRAAPPEDAVPTDPTVEPGGVATGARRGRPDGTGSAGHGVPQAVAAWLDAVETRVRRAEELTDATADEAATALDGCDGVDRAASLPDELDDDIRALRAIRKRIDDLAARGAAADPEPVVSALVAAAGGNAPTGRHPETDAEGASSGSDASVGATDASCGGTR